MSKYTNVIQAKPATYNRTTTYVFPQSGNSFGTGQGSQQLMEFYIPSVNFIDPSSMYLTADVQIKKPTAVPLTHAVVLDNPGLAACIERFSIYNNQSGTLMNSYTGVADIVNMNIAARGQSYQDVAARMGYNPSLNDITLTDAANPIVSTGGTSIALMTAATNAPTVLTNGTAGNKVNLALPMSLLGGPLSPSTGALIPALCASDRGYAFKVTFNLASASQALFCVNLSGGEAADTANGIATATDSVYYELTNVKLSYDSVSLGDEATAMVLKLAESDNLRVHYDEVVARVFSGISATTTAATRVIPKYTGSLKSVVMLMKPAKVSFGIPNCSWCGKMGLTSAQLKVGSKVAPNVPLDTSNVYNASSYCELAKCYKSLYSNDGPFLKNYNVAFAGDFAVGVNLSDISYSESRDDDVVTVSGLNTSSTGQLEWRYSKNATSLDYTEVYILTSDNFLQVGKGTSLSIDQQ